MIKVSVIVQNLAQLEGLVAQVTALDLQLGGLTVVPDEEPPQPSRARRQSIRKATSKRRKRRSSKMSIKLATPTKHIPPLVARAHEILKKEFGDEPFLKGLASAVIQKNLKMKSRPTSHVSMLLDAGGLVQA